MPLKVNYLLSPPFLSLQNVGSRAGVGEYLLPISGGLRMKAQAHTQQAASTWQGNAEKDTDAHVHTFRHRSSLG